MMIQSLLFTAFSRVFSPCQNMGCVMLVHSISHTYGHTHTTRVILIRNKKLPAQASVLSGPSEFTRHRLSSNWGAFYSRNSSYPLLSATRQLRKPAQLYLLFFYLSPLCNLWHSMLQNGNVSFIFWTFSLVCKTPFGIFTAGSSRNWVSDVT